MSLSLSIVLGVAALNALLLGRCYIVHAHRKGVDPSEESTGPMSYELAASVPGESTPDHSRISDSSYILVGRSLLNLKEE